MSICKYEKLSIIYSEKKEINIDNRAGSCCLIVSNKIYLINSYFL